NSGSAMPVEEPALRPARLRVARLPTGCGRGPALIGRTPAIALNARTAQIVHTRKGRLTGKQVIAKPQNGRLHGT
ncbi:hypothetical protein, partial [Bradyrhizobium sp.]|uniref:hypothetical protein n=1 Tax=Bradyrhizobium sp. TaxID=376 RepID=UPI003C74BABF